jgi:hypothetical protein
LAGKMSFPSLGKMTFPGRVNTGLRGQASLMADALRRR